MGPHQSEIKQQLLEAAPSRSESLRSNGRVVSSSRPRHAGQRAWASVFARGDRELSPSNCGFDPDEGGRRGEGRRRRK